MSLAGYKNSPRAKAISATTRTITVAEEFIDGRDLSTVEEAEIPTIIHSLQAIRHKAMVSDDNQKQKRCDYLISEFNIILNQISSQKTPKRTRSAWTPKGLQDQEQQYMGRNAQRQTIELGNDEFLQLNQIVDSLLNECEIDSIEPQAIPKLDFVLKQRKKHAIEDGGYSEAKKIDEQIAKLSKIQQSNGQAKFSIVFQYHQNPQLVDEAKNKLRNSEKYLLKLKVDLEEENGRISEQRDIEQALIFKSIEEEVMKFEKYKEEVDLGFGFKPSRFLLDMRIMENRYVSSGLYDEAAEQRRKADKREIEERKFFDKKSRSLLNQKERQQKEAHRQKIAAANQYWDNAFEKTQKKYAVLITKAENEISSIQKWIKRLQGTENEESYSESATTATNEDSIFEIYENSTSNPVKSNRKQKSSLKKKNQASFNQRLPEASTTPLVIAHEPFNESNPNNTLGNPDITPNRTATTVTYMDSPLDNDTQKKIIEDTKIDNELAAATISVNTQDVNFENDKNEKDRKTEIQFKLVPPTLEGEEPKALTEEAHEVQINIDIPGFEEDNPNEIEQTKEASKKIKKVVKKVKKVVKKTT